MSTKGAKGKRTQRTGKKRTRPAVTAPATMAGAMALEASDATKARALAAYREFGTVLHACQAAGIGRRTWYDWMESDAAFARSVLDASEEVSDDLEKEAVKRAKEGSDTLIIFLLKSRRRSQYGDKQTIEVVHPEVQKRLDEQARRVLARESWTRAELVDLFNEVWK